MPPQGFGMDVSVCVKRRESIIEIDVLQVC